MYRTIQSTFVVDEIKKCVIQKLVTFANYQFAQILTLSLSLSLGQGMHQHSAPSVSRRISLALIDN